MRELAAPSASVRTLWWGVDTRHCGAALLPMVKLVVAGLQTQATRRIHPTSALARCAKLREATRTVLPQTNAEFWPTREMRGLQAHEKLYSAKVGREK